MGNPLQDLFQGLADRLDDGLLPALYEAASLSPDQVRRQLQDRGLAYADARAGQHPRPAELEESARRLIRGSARFASLRGAVGAFGGMGSLPPETVAALVQTLRLAQRLAVVYGHDLETDAGRLILTRALGAAWEIELAAQGTWSMQVRQLPKVLAERLAAAGGTDPQRVALMVGRQAGSLLGRRIAGLIPGLGTTLGALSARRALLAQGGRMAEVFRRAWQGDLSLEGPILEAQELPRPS